MYKKKKKKKQKEKKRWKAREGRLISCVLSVASPIRVLLPFPIS
jgi:hypothetical protein